MHALSFNLRLLLRAVLLVLGALVSSSPDRGSRHPDSTDTVALEGGLVHTLVPGEEPRVATILISGERVLAVGPGLEIPPGTVRHDLSGSHVVPMLIDGYVNFDPQHDTLYTASGVGLVRDVGGNRAMLLHERDEERRARATGPSLITAGALLDGDPPSTAEAVVLRTPEAAESLLPILFEEQIDFLSVFLRLEPATWLRVIELGHANGLEVWGPVPIKATLDQALAAKQDGIHFLDALLPEGVHWDIVQLPAFTAPSKRLAAAGTALIPMLSPNALRLVNQGARPELSNLFTLLHPTYEVWWKNELMARIQTMSEERLKVGRRVMEKQGQLLSQLDADGVRLLIGSGSPQPWLFPGQALHQELSLWVAAGLTPERVLYLATRGAAEILGVEDEYGSIQPGALANFIVTDTDPREDIAALRESRLLVTRGRLLEKAELEDLLLTLEQRQTLVREELNRRVEVAPPPTPPEGVVILDGVVESTAFGLRTSTESFRVVRLPEDKLAFLGRIIYPREAGQPERELVISQVMQAGRLVNMEIALRNGDQIMLHKGLWTANRWRMQRQLGPQKIDTTSTLGRPVCADLGSVTSLLVLGQSPLREQFSVLSFHEGLTPEMVGWAMELDDRGTHQVRTHIGRLAFRFNDLGAPEKSLSAVGSGSESMQLREADAHGGAGLPLPADKREAIAALLEASAEAREAADEPAAEPADAGAGDGHQGAEDEDDEDEDDEGQG